MTSHAISDPFTGTDGVRYRECALDWEGVRIVAYVDDAGKCAEIVETCLVPYNANPPAWAKDAEFDRDGEMEHDSWCALWPTMAAKVEEVCRG